MRKLYLVTYDIMDPKRWRRVHRTMLGFGEPLQYSVFACDLSDQDKVRLLATLEEQIEADTDRFMVVDLGPADGRASDRVTFLGRPAEMPERNAVIV